MRTVPATNSGHQYKADSSRSHTGGDMSVSTQAVSPRNSRTHELAGVFMGAKAAAQNADPGPDHDGGTANLDSVLVRLRHTHAATIEAAADLAGLTVVRSHRGSGAWTLCGLAEGQADRRTRMVEAAAAYLRTAGYSAAIWYVID